MSSSYSTIFGCLYDHNASVAQASSTPPYTVFRATQARSDSGQPTSNLCLQDFCVIWDEDHDDRVIRALERLHLAGLLWPVVFAAEHKGLLTLILQAGLSLDDVYLDEVRGICEDKSWLGDVWAARTVKYTRPGLGSVFSPPAGTIEGATQQQVSYLHALDLQWKLGLRRKPLRELRSWWDSEEPSSI